jgi:hypothetical protein
MKSLTTYLCGSALCLWTTASLFAQSVVPAVSLGDPIPAYQPDHNLVRVSGSSCNTCAASIGFQACCEPAKVVSVPCDCKAAPACNTCSAPACSAPACSAPACAVAAKPAPCKACDVPKLLQHHARPAAPCATCAAPAPAHAFDFKKLFSFHNPAPATCNTCATPAPAACSTCAPKPDCQVAKPAPCNTCPAPAPAACATSDACKTTHKHEYRRPILETIKGLFGSHAAPSKTDGCSTCSTCAPTATPVPAVARQSTPMTSSTVPAQGVSYYRPIESSVPAALAPYSAHGSYSTAIPPAEVSISPR